MSEPNRTIKKGSLLMVSSGEYSDYQVRTVCRALQEIDPEGLRREWLSIHPDQEATYAAEFSAFVAWLVASGIVEEVECAEFYLGAYSTLEPEVRP